MNAFPAAHDVTASKIRSCEPLRFVVEWANRLNERCISERPNPDNALAFAEGLWAAGYVGATVTVRGGTYNENLAR